MSFPKCFGTQQDFDTWVSLSENDGDKDPRISFCESCTNRFQKLMKKLDFCENPDFVINEEDEDIIDGEQWNQRNFTF